MDNSTVLCALYIESEDRMANATRTLTFLLQNLPLVRIVIVEVGRPRLMALVRKLNAAYDERICYEYIRDESPIFHRTKYLNVGLRKVRTEVVIIHDIDCILPVESYKEAERLITSGECQIVSPFTNPPGVYYVAQAIADDLLDLDKHDAVMRVSRRGFAGNGFVVFFDSKAYAQNGGEDESYCSWTCEDDSRLYCNKKLGLTHGRVEGHVFHCEHFRGINSSKENPYWKAGEMHFKYLNGLDTEQTRQYFAPKRIDITVDSGKSFRGGDQRNT